MWLELSLPKYRFETNLASSISVNLALAFARRGVRAGILDTDIYGPSIPSLLNLSGEPRLDESTRLSALEC